MDSALSVFSLHYGENVLNVFITILVEKGSNFCACLYFAKMWLFPHISAANATLLKIVRSLAGGDKATCCLTDSWQRQFSVWQSKMGLIRSIHFLVNLTHLTVVNFAVENSSFNLYPPPFPPCVYLCKFIHSELSFCTYCYKCLPKYFTMYIMMMLSE